MSTKRLKKTDRDFSKANAKVNNEDMNIQTEHYCEAETPNDAQLVLLCLDYLRSLHRSRCIHRDDLDSEVGISQDYLTLAIWAMSNAISRPSDLTHGTMRDADRCIEDSLQFGNDAFFQPNHEHFTYANKSVDKKLVKLSHTMRIPCLEMMECELRYKFNPKSRALGSVERTHLESDEGTEGNDSDDCGVSKALMSCRSSVHQHRSTWYEYEDNHHSNQYRFYDTMGLSSNIPLTLPHIVEKGITSLRARSRFQAEENMMAGELFANFLDAVSKNGTFKISDREIMNHPDFRNDMTEDEVIGINDQIHERRFRKVVTKYRTKLASKYQEQETEDRCNELLDFNPIDMNTAVVDVQIDNDGNDNINIHKKMKEQKEKYYDLFFGGDKKKDISKQDISGINEEKDISKQDISGINEKKDISKQDTSGINKYFDMFDMPSKLKELDEKIVGQQDDDVTLVAESVFGEIGSVVANHQETADLNADNSKTSTLSNALRSSIDKHDFDTAEYLKAKGNAAMQRKQYEKAKSHYTDALKLAPTGPTSHVYFSNRAAALLSMRNFNEAVWDAERSIALKPNYAKAHARLGLAHFHLERYQEAAESYTLAVKLDPDNAQNISYLEKSKKKLLLLVKNRKEGEQTTIKNREYKTSSQMKAPSDIDEEGRQVRNEETADQLKAEGNKAMERKQFKNREYKTSSQMKAPGDIDEERQQVRNEEVADQLKVEGNKAMERKEFEKAVQYYSKSLSLAPAGRNSHIYFSNRATAFCYLECYEEAELDAERSLALNPEYGKAYARLGLSRFFLKDYFGAMDAYESALIYDPTNTTSKSYLEMAKAKVDCQGTYTSGITSE